MGSRLARAAPLGALVAAAAGCGVFGPSGLNWPVPDMLSFLGLVVSLVWLVVRGVRHVAADRRFRRHGGAVIGQQQGPTVAELAERVERAESRLDEHHAALKMVGRDDDPQSRRDDFYVIPGQGA